MDYQDFFRIQSSEMYFLMHLFLASSILFFSIFQYQWSECLLLKFTPLIKHNKNPRNNFFQIDEFVLYFSLSFGKYPTNAPNSIIGPLNDSPDLRSYLRFRVCQEVLDILQIVIAFHGIWPPFFIQSRLQQYGWCPFFYSTYSSFCNSLSLLSSKWSCSMIPWWFFTRFAKFWKIVSIK